MAGGDGGRVVGVVRGVLLSIVFAAGLLLLASGVLAVQDTFLLYLPVVLKPVPVPTQTSTPTATYTATPMPTATAIPTATPTPTLTPISGQNMQCQQFGNEQLCGWVSNGSPEQNSTVVVYGRYLINGAGQGGLGMMTYWHYKSTTPSCSGSTQTTGVASCARDIGRATHGYTVQVDIEINGRAVQTWFTPQ